MEQFRLAPLILVADDEVTITAMMERIFAREGYAVHAVFDGLAAVNAATDMQPDLVLLDVQMPLMDGFEVLSALKNNPSTASIPIIVVTAKARHPNEVAHGLNLGADDFIQKPFDPRELLARVQNKIRARQTEERLYQRTQELNALLSISEELNQIVDIQDMMAVVPYLVKSALIGDISCICLLDDDLELIDCNIFAEEPENASALDTEMLVQRFLTARRALMWPYPDEPLLSTFENGLVAPLEHGNKLLGVLAILSNSFLYSGSDADLFSGLARQVALNIRNAQLYEIQANYALHLEEMVEAKTAELRSAQEMLIRAEKLASIGHLAASIAHEINNPLQPIRINLEIMLEDLQTGNPVDITAIQSTQENVERIRRIVHQLLDFSGRRNPDETSMNPINVTRVIEGVMNLNRQFFEKERMTLASKMAEDLPILGIKDQLEQVFMNLMLNAKAAMQPGGVLHISALNERNEVIIQFADTGSGIPANILNKIFDPFFSTKPNGTGLGLFVSYQIVENHHGLIEVNSKVGRGTVFTIRLPFYQAG